MSMPASDSHTLISCRRAAPTTSSNRGPGGRDINVASTGRHVIDLNKSLKACKRISHPSQINSEAETYICHFNIGGPKLYCLAQTHKHVVTKLHHPSISPSSVYPQQILLLSFLIPSEQRFRGTRQTTSTSCQRSQLL